MSELEKEEWLEVSKDALVAEGFQDTPLQIVQPGQRFGLVKKLYDIWEMHVRGFDDGRLESEIEVSRDYLEHFDDKYRRDATKELTQILDAYGMPYTIKGDISHAIVELPHPETVTPWKPIVALVGIGVLLYFLFGKR